MRNAASFHHTVTVQHRKRSVGTVNSSRNRSTEAKSSNNGGE